MWKTDYFTRLHNSINSSTRDHVIFYTRKRSRGKKPKRMEYPTIYLRGRGADEFDAILQSSFFRIPFVADSSRLSEYFPMIPPNKSLSCMVVTTLMKVHTHTLKPHTPLLLVPAVPLVLVLRNFTQILIDCAAVFVFTQKLTLHQRSTLRTNLRFYVLWLWLCRSKIL